MSKLYQVQQEILNYLLNRSTDFKILSKDSREELDIYKSLILNSAEKFLASGFQHSYTLLKSKWREIIKLYLENFPSQSPIYFMIGKNFPEFIRSDLFQKNFSYPGFLGELIEFEWTKIELFNSNEDQKNKSSTLNPVYKILKFNYPITQIIAYLADEDISLEDKITTEIETDSENLFVYRDTENLQIKTFMLSDSVIEVLKYLEQGLSPEEITGLLCNTEDSGQISQIKQELFYLLENLKKLNILIKY